MVDPDCCRNLRNVPSDPSSVWVFPVDVFLNNIRHTVAQSRRQYFWRDTHFAESPKLIDWNIELYEHSAVTILCDVALLS